MYLCVYIVMSDYLCAYIMCDYLCLFLVKWDYIFLLYAQSPQKD